MSTEFQRLSQASLLEHIETVGPVKFTIRNIVCYGTRNELSETERLEVGAICTDAVATLLMPLMAFIPALRVGEKVVIYGTPGVKGETLRIGAIMQDQLVISLTLQDIQK
jgi:hypothetical protein